MILDKVRRWARGHTRRGQYSPVGIAFHWSIALLVFAQIWLGWRSGRLPVGGEKLEAYQVHAQIGLAILCLTAMRLIWRALIPGPVNDADEPGWQSTAARWTHAAFYVCLIGLPLTGWAMLSATARELPLGLPGGARWPHLPFEALSLPAQWSIEAWAERAHGVLVVTLLVLIVLHVGAALKHEIIDRDDVLRGMLPGVRWAEDRAAQALRRMRRLVRSRLRSSSG